MSGRVLKTLIKSCCLSAFLTTISYSKENIPEVLILQQEDRQAIDNLKISCQDLKDCPEYAGGLVFLKKVRKMNSVSGFEEEYVIGTCSQTLIARDKVLTSRHCLPEESLGQGLSCTNITLIFPKTGKKEAERIGCRSVIDLSLDYSYNNIGKNFDSDWAVLQLEHKIDRTPIEIDISGVPNKTNLVTFPVNYETSRIEETDTGSARLVVNGKVKKISCQSHMNNYFSIFYNHPKSHILSLFCDTSIIGGHSGSAFISQDGKLSGLISVRIDNDNEDDIHFMGKRYKPEYLDQIAVGINAQCISAFNNNHNNPICTFGGNDESKMGTGLLLSFFYGITPGDTAELEEVIAADDTIQWEDHNRDFFETIYENKSRDLLLDMVGFSIYDYFYSFSYSLQYPKTPVCIKASKKKEGTFKVMIPKMTGLYREIIIDSRGNFVFPMEPGFLQFELKYDATKNHFSGTMPRLDNDLREYFMKLSGDLERQFSLCMASKNPCLDMYRVMDQIESLKFSSGVDESLFNNEEFISQNRMGAGKMILPVCD